MSMFLELIRRDLVLSLRLGGGAGMAIGFFLTVVILIPLGIGPDLALLQRIAPGVLWITLLLSVLLSADRIFQLDEDDGSLELFFTGPMPLELVVLAKSASHWISAGLPLALAAPLLGILLNLNSALFLPIFAAMFVGSIALSLLATIGAAITVGLRRGGLIVSLLILPLYIPVLIFGVAATAGVSTMPGLSLAARLILIAIMLTALVVAPIASAALLRAHMR